MKPITCMGPRVDIDLDDTGPDVEAKLREFTVDFYDLVTVKGAATAKIRVTYEYEDGSIPQARKA